MDDDIVTRKMMMEEVKPLQLAVGDDVAIETTTVEGGETAAVGEGGVDQSIGLQIDFAAVKFALDVSVGEIGKKKEEKKEDEDASL